MPEHFAEASVSGDTLTITRMFDTSRELLFKMFTEPRHVARWWAPNGYTIPVCRIDLRPGGLWHYAMRSPSGDVHWVRAIYQEIAVPERVVYIASFADEHANPTDDIPAQHATLTFEQVGKQTKFTLVMRFESEEALRATVKMGLVPGFRAALRQLDDYLFRLKSETETEDEIQR